MAGGTARGSRREDVSARAGPPCKPSKAWGGLRPLGIPTIRDRVAQTAAKLVLEPIFEADFEDNAYGYRPRRGAAEAIKEVHRLVCRGFTDVVDADLSSYFDTIPHADLLRSVARRVVDRHVLHLIKVWLVAPVEERDGDGTRRMTGGRDRHVGTPQGGVVSPLLSNIYMNRFLKHWRLTGRDDVFQARDISYADDFVILSRGYAVEALAWTRSVMMRLGLTLNEAKTSVKDARQRASIYWATRSARIASARMATGTWAQARPRRAYSVSRRRSATFWCPATKALGRRPAAS